MSRYYLIAGEASGDLHASNLVKEINLLDKDAVFRGFGGDKMIHEGVEIVQHYKDIAFMGFKEVILHLSTIRKAMNLCKTDILKFKPDVLILVDYPGFNSRMAKFAKGKGLRVMYYISPQFWAWKENRVKRFKDRVDGIFLILPFEKDFYQKHQIDAFFCGHPLPEVVDSFRKDPEFEQTINPEGKDIIAILPGSRKQEIVKLMPLIYELAGEFKECLFVIAASAHIPMQLYGSTLDLPSVKIIIGKTYDLLSIAKAGIVKSGTAALEAALFSLPIVVCYRTTWLNYYITKRMIKVNYISLVNLILNRGVVKELIQNSYNKQNLSQELNKLLHDSPYREYMIAEYGNLRQHLYGEGASRRAAVAILKKMSN